MQHSCSQTRAGRAIVSNKLLRNYFIFIPFNIGLQQGREQGIAENQLAIIKNMLNMDMTDDTIQTVTGCTAEYLASVKKNIAN